jgi:hypothetical protein
MKITEAIIYTSIAVIVVSLFFIGTELTGFAFANDTGIVNVTIGTSAAISFTANFLEFGSGAVDPGAVAVLDSKGNVTNGTWTPISGELILENIGNVDVTLQLQTDKNASSFIGGSGNQAFEAMVANASGNVGACIGNNTFSSYAPINETPQDACSISFGYASIADEIIIDFNMTIPDDATGTRTIEIKAVGTYTT